MPVRYAAAARYIGELWHIPASPGIVTGATTLHGRARSGAATRFVSDAVPHRIGRVCVGCATNFAGSSGYGRAYTDAGEGHGRRKVETVCDSLAKMEAFLLTCVIERWGTSAAR